MSKKMETFEQIMEELKDRIPVPVVEVANRLGIDVYSTKDLESDQSGLIRREGDGKISIYINENQPAVRKRFTIAHEIAHFLKHKSILENDEYITKNKELVLFRKENVDRNNKSLEVEANKLAAEILMPRDKFLEEWERASDIEEIAETFGVSTIAAAIRANQLTKA